MLVSRSMTEPLHRERVLREPPPPGVARLPADGVTSIVRPVLSIRADATLEELSSFLLEHRVTAAVVLDDQECVLGFVSMTDLVREHMLEGDTHDELPSGSRRLAHGFHVVAPTQRTTVRDIMMPFVLMVGASTSIPHAAAVMAARAVHRLVVISEHQVVGVIEARDVLRWIARRFGVAVADDPDAGWRRSCENAL